ncbi:hypothetical protein B0H13DRAFT_1891108 [Mycena leptocephala]|nr:hypothetical protein B0H13DRAFT_1891108 [Mycena leptocephala]
MTDVCIRFNRVDQWKIALSGPVIDLDFQQTNRFGSEIPRKQLMLTANDTKQPNSNKFSSVVRFPVEGWRFKAIMVLQRPMIPQPEGTQSDFIAFNSGGEDRTLLYPVSNTTIFSFAGAKFRVDFRTNRSGVTNRPHVFPQPMAMDIKPSHSGRNHRTRKKSGTTRAKTENAARTRKKKKFKSMFREWTQAHRDCDTDKSEWETKIRRFEADVKLKE